jgi:hypothetical protein
LRCHCHYCCFRSSCFCYSRCHVCWLLWLLLLFFYQKAVRNTLSKFHIFCSKQLSAVASAVVHDKISSFFNVVVIGNNAIEMPLPILLFSLFMFLLLSLSCLLVVVAASSFFTKKQLETHSQNFIFFAQSNCQLSLLLLYMTRLAHFSMLLSLVIMHLRCHCHFCCFRSSCFCNSRCHVCWLL